MYLNKLKGFLSGEHGKKLVVILGVLGMLIILLADCGASAETKSESPAQPGDSFADYRTDIQQQLTEIVGSISGVGRVQVLVTLENSGEYSYVTEKKSSTDKSSGESNSEEKSNDETQTVIISNSDGERALVKTEKAPSIKGVVVVCEGGDNAAVAERVTSAVTTALNISSKRVCVTKMS